MHVLVLLTDAFESIGGIETFNRALTNALDDLAAEHQWTIEILSLLDKHPHRTASPYIRSGKTTARGFSGNRLAFSIAAIRSSWKSTITIIGHINLISLIYGMTGCRKYLIVFGMDVWKALSPLQQLALHKIDRILSISQYTRDQMIRFNGVLPQTFAILPPTLDPLYSEGQRSTGDLKHPDPTVLTVSRLGDGDRYKNIDRAIQAMPQILKYFPALQYIIIGEGPDRSRLEQLARAEGIQDKVHFAGSVSKLELACFLESCDLFLLPSTKEGFGIVFLEAMHHAKPCIAALAGGIPEVIEHGVTGLLIDPDKPGELARSVCYLLLNTALRRQYGEAGRQRLASQFSYEVFRHRLESELLQPSHSAVGY